MKDRMAQPDIFGVQLEVSLGRGAIFQEISWNQEISDRKKELQEK